MLFSQTLIRYQFFQKTMEHQQNKQVSHSQPECSFCRPNNLEVRLILKNVIKRLKAISLKTKRKIRLVETAYISQPSISIQRLLKMLFNRHKFELTLSRNCPHYPLLNLVRRHLSCHPDELQQLLDTLCDSVAQRHYELEVIITQIKNVQGTVSQLIYQPQVKQQKRLTDQEQQKPDLPLCKTEQEIKPIYHTGTPPTVSPQDYMFTSLPQHYNMLFYTGQFYQ